MVRILAAIAALVLVAMPALAADQWSRGSTKDAPIPSAADEAPVSWAGFYVGGQVGYGLTGLSTEEGDYEPFIGLRTFTGGIHAGFDMQIGRIVAGPYAEVNFTDVEEISYQWEAGGRAGVLVTDRALVYGLLAWSKLVPEDGRIDSVDGVKYGGGVELAVTRNLFMNLAVTQTMFDIEDLPDDVDATDNRATVGFHLKFGGSPLPSLD